LSAFGGAIIAAGLTYKIAHGLDNRREKKAERRLSQSIHTEIKARLDFLEESLKPNSREVPYGSKPSDRLQIEIPQLKGILFQMAALPKTYSDLPTERKIKAFPPEYS
jgi:hypothetical protein